MQSDGTLDAEIGDFIWPLTGELHHVDWHALAEEIRIRDRLAEIAAHVEEMHVQPRLRRLGASSEAMVSALRQGVVAGPAEGPLWQQTLREPVPRALREEWATLVCRLRELHRQPSPTA